jgi:hypothetical protein
MILSKTVTVKLTNNVKHYESLGYVIPKYLDKRHRLRIKKGTAIVVKVLHLLKNSRNKVLCKCDKCGKEKYIKYYIINKINNYFCRKCSMNTNEYKEKISKSRLGKKHTKEAIHKMNKNHWCKGKYGKDNFHYNHNLSDIDRYTMSNRNYYPGYYQWQQSVLKYDNYTCQKCGSKNHLCTHHINNWSTFKEQRIDINNGITLCNKCHKLIHNIYGRKTTKEHFDKFMKLII